MKIILSLLLLYSNFCFSQDLFTASDFIQLGELNDNEFVQILKTRGYLNAADYIPRDSCKILFISKSISNTVEKVKTECASGFTKTVKIGFFKQENWDNLLNEIKLFPKADIASQKETDGTLKTLILTENHVFVFFDKSNVEGAEQPVFETFLFDKNEYINPK
jgi:hypothetical protein